MDLRTTRIDAVMTRSPKTIGSDALAVEAAQLMELHQINALLVLDEARHVVGALNIHDLLRARVVYRFPCPIPTSAITRPTSSRARRRSASPASTSTAR
jgi:CBS-domain-containing membrane protein